MVRENLRLGWLPSTFQKLTTKKNVIAIEHAEFVNMPYL